MSGEKSPRMYDSMAQAYHLIGKHEEAAQAQEIAIHLLGDADDALKEKMSQRLQVYSRAAAKEGSAGAENEKGED
mgnify:CR=1 FL=1